jgi:hypothetical protein
MKVTHLPVFQHVEWHPSRNELRRFAVSMLIGFAVLGLLAAWRAGTFSTTTFILWCLGCMLALAALVPGLGRIAYLTVYLPTSLIGYVMSRVILALIFFLVIVPIGALLRRLGKDLLQLQAKRGQGKWRRIEHLKDRNSYYRQF